MLLLGNSNIKETLWKSIEFENLDKADQSHSITIDLPISVIEEDDEILVENYITKNISAAAIKLPLFVIFRENVTFLDHDVFNSQIDSTYASINAAEKQFMIDMHRTDLYINGHYCRWLNPQSVINYIDYTLEDITLSKRLISCLTQAIMVIPIHLIYSKITGNDLYIGELESSCDTKKAMQIDVNIEKTINITIMKKMRIFNTIRTICNVNIKMEFECSGNNPVIITITPF